MPFILRNDVETKDPYKKGFNCLNAHNFDSLHATMSRDIKQLLINGQSAKQIRKQAQDTHDHNTNPIYTNPQGIKQSDSVNNFRNAISDRTIIQYPGDRGVIECHVDFVVAMEIAEKQCKSNSSLKAKCDNCNGTGKSWLVLQCDRCNGTGTECGSTGAIIYLEYLKLKSVAASDPKAVNMAYCGLWGYLRKWIKERQPGFCKLDKINGSGNCSGGKKATTNDTYHLGAGHLICNKRGCCPDWRKGNPQKQKGKFNCTKCDNPWNKKKCQGEWELEPETNALEQFKTFLIEKQSNGKATPTTQIIHNILAQIHPELWMEATEKCRGRWNDDEWGSRANWVRSHPRPRRLLDCTLRAPVTEGMISPRRLAVVSPALPEPTTTHSLPVPTPAHLPSFPCTDILLGAGFLLYAFVLRRFMRRIPK